MKHIPFEKLAPSHISTNTSEMSVDFTEADVVGSERSYFIYVISFVDPKRCSLKTKRAKFCTVASNSSLILKSPSRRMF